MWCSPHWPLFAVILEQVHQTLVCSSVHESRFLRLSSAGPAPVAAMQLLQRLLLFPLVFALPQPLASAVGAEYGARCVACMAAADAVLKAQGMQVGA